MLSRLGSLLGSAISAIGRGIDSALGAVAGAVLSAATALAPKAPPSQFGGSPDLGVCPGGKNWRGPFATAVDAYEYSLDIPVPTSIHQYADGWWVYIEYPTPWEAEDDSDTD